MSGSLALGAATVAGLVVGEAINAFLTAPRIIDVVVPDCTIEERHSDRLQTTSHPVERGANISDHAFMQPFEVSLRYGFSNGIFVGFDNVRTKYIELQRLQQSRVPFMIITGKRVYQNMLITEMDVTTDQHTENVLMIELHCQQVIIVSTSAATISPAQSMPQQTGDVVNTGQQQLSPASGGIPGLQ